MFVDGSASLSASFSFTADQTGDNDALIRTDGAGGDGLFTNEFVSVNMTGLKGPDIVSVEMTI